MYNTMQMDPETLSRVPPNQEWMTTTPKDVVSAQRYVAKMFEQYPNDWQGRIKKQFASASDETVNLMKEAVVAELEFQRELVEDMAYGAIDDPKYQRRINKERSILAQDFKDYLARAKKLKSGQLVVYTLLWWHHLPYPKKFFEALDLKETISLSSFSNVDDIIKTSVLLQDWRDKPYEKDQKLFNDIINSFRDMVMAYSEKLAVCYNKLRINDPILERVTKMTKLESRRLYKPTSEKDAENLAIELQNIEWDWGKSKCFMIGRKNGKYDNRECPKLTAYSDTTPAIENMEHVQMEKGSTGGIILTDQNTLNGTFVYHSGTVSSGVKLRKYEKTKELHHGTLVCIGNLKAVLPNGTTVTNNALYEYRAVETSLLQPFEFEPGLPLEDERITKYPKCTVQEFLDLVPVFQYWNVSIPRIRVDKTKGVFTLSSLNTEQFGGAKKKDVIEYCKIMGRKRRVHYKGRTKYVRYLGELQKLSYLKKLAKSTNVPKTTT